MLGCGIATYVRTYMKLRVIVFKLFIGYNACLITSHTVTSL